MALRDEFEKSGLWLFRWRSYLPLFLVALFLFSMRSFHHLGDSETMDRVWEVFCLLISLLGLGIRFMVIGFTPRGTSGRNTKAQKADVLNTTGIYSQVRHPLYLGNFFMGLGIALFSHLWWLVLIYVLAFTVYYERIMFGEEAFLRGKFGEQFEKWAAKTPAFFPHFKNWAPSSNNFSFKNILRREYNGFAAVIFLMFVLEVIGDFVEYGNLHFDPMWVALLVLAAVVWVVLLALKRWTRVLKVAGR